MCIWYLCKCASTQYVFKRSYSLKIIVCQLTTSADWEDISLVLNEADASFGNVGAWAFGAAGGVMSTPDGGRTWNFTTLEVPETAIQLA
jgi:photosystem II stability/assembly factor-like uncharacterized protein